ncbi:MAG: hypothetical protein J7M26_03590 [Armatimonadetes bacterium]|nr:hypothetical protein [Armatimonadota bacterium]
MSSPLYRKAKIKKQYFTPGFHSDVIWLEDQRDYAVVLMGCTRQYLDACRADDAFGVFLHELTYLKPYVDSNPGEGEYLRELIAAGRVGTGGAHSLPSETIISGEAIVRNFIQGRRYHEARLGDRPWVLMLWDIFGHVSQLPQIAAGCRFDAVIWSKNIRGARPLFFQLGPDGTTMLTRRLMYGFGDEGMEEDLRWLQACVAAAESLGLDVALRLDCNDFRAPRGWLVGRAAELARRSPSIIISGQAHRRYFEHLLRQHRRGKLFIPTLARDFEWHHQGTGVAHIDLKIANRLCENALVNAEKFACIASQFGARYPWEALDKAWRQVLFNQHHDAITGPCCDRSYFDLMDGYREALELANQVLDRSLTYLAGAADTAAPAETATSSAAPLTTLVVFNSLNWARRDVAEADLELPRAVRSFAIQTPQGEPVPFEVVEASGPGEKVRKARVRLLVDVPALGYATFHVVPSSDPLPLVHKLPSAGVVEIENEYYRVVFSAEAGGGIVSLYDKQLGEELVNLDSGPANELVSLEEDIADHPEPPWEVMTAVGGKRYFSRDYPAKLEVFRGPVTARVRVSGRFKDCRRVQETVLIQGSRRIEFITDLERYRGKEHLHVIAFPVRVPGGVPVFDDRFGCIVKRKSRGYMDFRTWQWRNYSDCGARQLYQWLDLSRSVTLRLGDDAINLGNTNLLIAQDRRLEEIAYSLEEALIGKGVPCSIFYDDCERERRAGLEHEDATLPVETPNEDLPWGTSFRIILDVGEGNEYLQALLGKLPAGVVRGLRAERKKKGVAVRLVMEEDIEMDLWEQPTPYPWPPLPTLIISAKTPAALRTAVEDLAGQIAERAEATLPPEAKAVGELPWTDRGVALLNRGTPLASVERDDTLALIFMHSVRWSRAHLDFKPVAEHKTHRFEYALYPHEGSWREGRVPQAAYEYNNRLMAVQADAGPGALPAEQAFLTCGDDVIITALKPEGYPLAGHDPVPEGRPQRVVVRLYEPTGFSQTTKLSWFAGVEAAQRTNMLEEPQRELRRAREGVRLKLTGFRIETVALQVPAPEVSLGEDELGQRVEPGQPVYFAHWEHNAGAAPLGYSPIGLSLQGDIMPDTHVRQGWYTVNTFTVGVVNNLPEPVSGTVRFELPENWRTLPAEIPYELGPRASASLPVTLVFDDRRPQRGAVKALLEHDGQTYEAVLEVGEPAQISWDVRRTARGVEVRLASDYPQPVRVDAYAVVPHELWGDVVEGAKLGLVKPRYARLVVPAGGRTKWLVDVDSEGVDAWITIKLAYHGRVEYKQLRL